MTRYVIDARQIRWNAAILRRELHGVPVIGVVKCDAYGAGLLPVSRKRCAGRASARRF